MKIKILLVVILCLGFSSCYKVQKPEKPELLLSESEMAHIILDLSLASAAKGVNMNLLKENAILPRDFVFKKHNIDSILFAKNNTYYSFDLEAYGRVYNKVRDSLNTLKKIAKKKEAIQSKKNAELKKLKMEKLKKEGKKLRKRLSK